MSCNLSLFCQSVSLISISFLSLDGSVVLNEFDSSFEGIISSFLARYPNYDTELESLWRNDQHYWKQK